MELWRQKERSTRLDPLSETRSFPVISVIILKKNASSPRGAIKSGVGQASRVMWSQGENSHVGSGT